MVRSIFSKHGGALGETNSVAFNFEKVGLVEYPFAVASAEAMFEAALEAGASDVESDEENGHFITCAPDDLAAVRDALEAKFKEPVAARFDWRPLNTIPLDKEGAEKLMAILEAFNEDDDIQRVFDNSSIPDEVMKQIEG